ncbi:MAG: Orotidine 5'-phosphate decarboxylase [Elusimicrobia bacterium]|nr:Orotidine 5'-phosphate decarboxylase [Elusimicrobiota bacterium]
MKPLIVALDVDTDKEALALIKATRKHVDLYKVGPTLVLRYGPDIFKRIRKTGKKIFLDLKFHDIPNTMARSIKEAARNGIFSATVHTSAGANALETVAELSGRPQIWGVTVLTSLSGDDLTELGIERSATEQVERLGMLAKRCKIDGVVASVGETSLLRKGLGPHLTIVTPGIRLADNALGDQKRVATPADAKRAGANFIVVGRPILDAKDPGLMAEHIMRDWTR